MSIEDFSKTSLQVFAEEQKSTPYNTLWKSQQKNSLHIIIACGCKKASKCFLLPCDWGDKTYETFPIEILSSWNKLNLVQPVILSKSCETVDSNLKYWKFRGGKKFRRREKILSSRGCMKLFQRRLHVWQKQLATLTTASKIFRSSWLAQETENKSWTLRVFLVLLAAFVSSVSTRKKKSMKRKQENINLQEFRWPRTHPTQAQSCSLILHLGFKKMEIIYLSLFTSQNN